MVVVLPEASQWAQRCAQDGEFQLAARHWNGGVALKVGEQQLNLWVRDGVPDTSPTQSNSGDAATAGSEAPGCFSLQGDDAFWSRMLAGPPPRFHTDFLAALGTGAGLRVAGDRLAYAQYYGAAMRAVELLRPERNNTSVAPRPAAAPVFDAPTGRYAHLNLAGLDHRIYFEEAGQGIPVLSVAASVRRHANNRSFPADRL